MRVQKKAENMPESTPGKLNGLECIPKIPGSIPTEVRLIFQLGRCESNNNTNITKST